MLIVFPGSHVTSRQGRITEQLKIRGILPLKVQESFGDLLGDQETVATGPAIDDDSNSLLSL